MASPTTIYTATYLFDGDNSGLKQTLSENERLVSTSSKEVVSTQEKSSGKSSKAWTVASTLISSATQKAFDVALSGAKSLAGGILSVGVDFEATMAQVSAISGATGADFDALSAKARELGASTRYSSSEVAEGFTYMAMAGWKTEDMLAGMGSVLNLATAAGSDLATTSDIVTDALTAFGLSAQDTGRFADVLAAASSNANTNVELMGETFKYVAPVAGAMGYSVEDTAAAIGLMANAGIKGSQAGTSLRSMLTRLASPTKDVSESMNELGVSITNSDGTMKSLGDVIGNLREAFSGLSEEQQAQHASSIAGEEAMNGLLAIVNASDEDFIKLTGAINESEGAAQRMSDTMANTTEGRMKELQAKVQELQIKAFEALQPAIDGVIKALGWCADHMEIVTPVVVALGAAFAAIKLTDFVSGLVSIGTTLVTTVIPAILSTTAALLTNPITWIVVGVVAAITALILLIANFDKVKEAVGVVFGWIGNFIGSTVENIKAFFSGAWEFITGIFSGIGDFFGGVFQGAWDAITGVFGGIGNFFKGVWDTIVGIFTGVGKVVGDAVSGAFKFVVNGVLGFVERFINGPINVLNGFIGVINGAFGWAGVNLGKISTVSLPRMYTGGIVPAVSGGMPIIAGDGGEDEWVVPESKMASLIEQLESRTDRGNGGDTYNIYVDGVFATSAQERRRVADQIIQAIQENNKRRFIGV